MFNPRKALLLVLGLAAAVPVFAAAADQPLLDEIHKAAKVACKDCHGSAKPESLPAEESYAAIDSACVSCHGDLKKMAPVSRPKLANPHINPHESHLVHSDCITCHKVHEPEQSYCLQCHNFSMPMPTEKPAAARK